MSGGGAAARLVDAGAPVALGADDPLIFGSRLADQYAMARVLGFTDAELASLARGSLRAPGRRRTSGTRRIRDIDAWLAADGPTPSGAGDSEEHRDA